MRDLSTRALPPDWTLPLRAARCDSKVAAISGRVPSCNHITAYILGAGASAHAGYPLASRLLQSLSDWLDRADESEHWVAGCRNRMVQVRETFGSLDDFEGILGKLGEYGHKRVKPTQPTTYRQDPKDIFHDCTERFSGEDDGDPDAPAEGFYPQYLRSDLIMGLREFFYQTEQTRSGQTAYDKPPMTASPRKRSMPIRWSSR